MLVTRNTGQENVLNTLDFNSERLSTRGMTKVLSSQRDYLNFNCFVRDRAICERSVSQVETRSMPSEGNQLFHCYNRGCGQKFDPNENREGNRNVFSNVLFLSLKQRDGGNFQNTHVDVESLQIHVRSIQELHSFMMHIKAGRVVRKNVEISRNF